MARSRTCPKCQSSMSEGFIIDHTESGRSVSAWVEGVPERSLWTGVKLRGKKPLDIVTWRCGSCGYLENYASGR